MASRMVDSYSTHSVTYSCSDERVYVHNIHVEHEHRNKGIATETFARLQRFYEKPIMLHCWSTLIPFYKKLGFTCIGPVEEGDGYYYMERKL